MVHKEGHVAFSDARLDPGFVSGGKETKSFSTRRGGIKARNLLSFSFLHMVAGVEGASEHMLSAISCHCRTSTSWRHPRLGDVGL